MNKHLTIRCGGCGAFNEVQSEFSRPLKCFVCRKIVQTEEQEKDWNNRLLLLTNPREPDYISFLMGKTWMKSVYLMPNGYTAVFDDKGHQLGPFQGRLDEVLDLIRCYKSNFTEFFDDPGLKAMTWDEFFSRWGNVSVSQ